MTTLSLMNSDAKPEKRTGRRAFLATVVTATAACMLSGGIYLVNQQKKELQDAVLSYMANPRFVHPKFTRQVTDTDADLYLLDLVTKTVYFTVPESQVESSLKKLTENPKNAKIYKPGESVDIGDRVTIPLPGYYMLAFL